MAQGSAGLKRRWFTAAGRDLLHEVQRRLKDGRPLDGLDLGLVGGRVDLRHAPLQASLRELVGVQLRGVDLSHAIAANLRLVDSEVTDCRFDSADCQFWQLRGCLVTDTWFVKADLRTSSLGQWHEERGNRYRRVSFRSARMRAVSTSAATYEDCDFSFAELNRVNFWQSSLVRCTFAGPVREVVFDGRLLGEGKPDANPMHEVDLSDAVLDSCDFRAVNLATVRLPNDPQVLLVDRTRVERAVAALQDARSGGVTQAALMMLDHVGKSLNQDGVTVLNLRDAGDAAGLLGTLLHDGAVSS